MRTNSILCSITVLALLTNAGTAHAQKNPADVVRTSGYTTDEAGLIKALTDSRPAVRTQAAALIGFGKYPDAIQPLKKALSSEVDANAKFTITRAEASLGDSDARAQLAAFCAPSHDDLMRNMAADFLQGIGDNPRACLDWVTEELSSQYAGVRESALLYLGHITALPPQFPDSLQLALLKVAEKDSQAHNRQLAAKVINQIGTDETKASFATAVH